MAPLFVGTLASVVGAAPTDRMFPANVPKHFLPEDDPALKQPEYFNELDKARDELWHGRYRKALYASHALPADTPAVELALLRAEALGALGETDAAITLLSAHADDGRAELLRGRLLLSAGRAREAIDALRPLAAQAPVPRRELGRALEASGDLAGAIEQYAWFVAPPQDYLKRFARDKADGFEDAAELVAAAGAIDRWATLTGAYRDRKDLHNAVLSMFVAAYDVVDRTYWPAHVEAARFLFEHSKLPQATEELEAAMSANPNDAGVLELLAAIQLDRREFAKLSAIARALRDVDRHSPLADRIDAANALLQRQSDRALACATSAVEKRPNDLPSLARLASVHAMRGETAQLESTLARIDAIDPDCAVAHYDVGRFCGLFFDAGGAVRHLRIATQRAPWWVQPLHELGDALLNEGLEDEARVALNDAYAIDPFNLKTVNFLRVLDELAKFKTVESDHFVLRFDDRDDPIVPLYIGPYMDGAYAELTTLFGYTFDRKPIIEVFPDASSFSVRTAGVPGLETFGASQGRVMTVVAPRAGETLGPFNWARVMRHEFVHTINLLQTNGRVPRWLTEGLAVWQEHVPFRFAWVPQEMAKRVTAGKLMSPAKMAEALLRPRGNDGEVAYMTGFWLVEFVDGTFGREAILKLLDGYKRGLSENDVFREATGLELPAFQEKFDAWAREKVKGWGYDEPTQKQADEIEKEAKRLTDLRSFDDAAEKWQELLKLQPMNVLPHRRLAGIYLRLNRPLDAAKHLEATVPIELQDNRLARQLATIYREAGEPDEAMRFAQTSVQIDPYDPIAHDLLAELLDGAGQKPRAEQERQVAKLLRERAERAQHPPGDRSRSR